MAKSDTLTQRIRPAVAEDAQAMADTYNEYLGKSTMDLSLKTAAYFRGIINHLDDRECMLVLESDQTMAGWGILKKYSPKEGYRFAGETSVYLHRDFLGKGLGTLLKQSLIDRARHLNYHHLVARIFASNEASIHYNRKLGYELVGIQRQVGFVNGHWTDVAIMQLILDV